MATLRPLLRTFLSRSKLLGGSTSRGGTNPWPASGNGYIRSRTAAGAEEYGLRSDIGHNGGVTTLVEAGWNGERGEGKGVRRSTSERRDSVGPLTSGQNWNNSETKLTDISSDDGQSWPTGIRKTTVTNVVETVREPQIMGKNAGLG